jgi:pSer/pThr/pTyr-binding forkhead associated (FHA) protein
MSKTSYEPAFEPAPKKGSTQIQDSETRSVTGFLVSYSANEAGDFWELREGKNFIGSGASNDIVLKDASVSKEHAIINVRKNQNDARLMTVITDQNSTNGVIVNEKDIEFTSHECVERDVIKIGNYEMLLITVDKQKYGLKTNEKLQLSKKEPERIFHSPYHDAPYDLGNVSRKRKTKPE